MVARKSSVDGKAGSGSTDETAGAKKNAARKVSAEPPADSSAKVAGGKGAARKTTTSTDAARKTAADKGVAKKSAGKKPAPAKAAEPARKTAKKTASAPKKDAARSTGAQTVAAKKTPVAKADQAEKVPTARAAAEPGELAVRPGEDPWSAQEVAEARTGLNEEIDRLREEIRASEDALNGLLRDSGDGAGDDDADTGTKNITREHEMALAAGARERLYQTQRALERLDAGTYGQCEHCGNAIGKARMQAFPSAVLCVECKQKQERR